MVAVMGASACAPEDEDNLPSLVQETEEGTPVEGEGEEAVDTFTDYTGVYDSEFYDDVEFYVGEEITVAAIVGEVISPNAFTIVNTADPQASTAEPVDIDATVIEPLLVIHEQEIPGLAPGAPVGVVGVVGEEFYGETVGQEAGLDLDTVDLEQWEGEAYIDGTDVASLTAAG